MIEANFDELLVAEFGTDFAIRESLAIKTSWEGSRDGQDPRAPHPASPSLRSASQDPQAFTEHGALMAVTWMPSWLWDIALESGLRRTEFGAILSTMRATSVRPITDLKTHTKEVIDQAIHSGEPVLITQNGRASVVVIDAKRHDDAQATLAMLKLLAQSQDSLARGDNTYSSQDVRRRAHASIGQASKR